MRSYVVLYFAVILLSCDNKIYDNYYSFTDDGWHTDSIVSFDYTVLDTTKIYNLSLNIRHTVDYEFQNLFLFLKANTEDTIEIILANKNGSWLGSGVSNVREFKYTFDNNRFFSRNGTYTLQIEQAMRYGSRDRIEYLENILDIGLIVSEQHE